MPFVENQPRVPVGAFRGTSGSAIVSCAAIMSAKGIASVARIVRDFVMLADLGAVAMEATIACTSPRMLR